MNRLMPLQRLEQIASCESERACGDVIPLSAVEGQGRGEIAGEGEDFGGRLIVRTGRIGY